MGHASPHRAHPWCWLIVASWGVSRTRRVEVFRIFGARAWSVRDDAKDASLICSGVLSRAKDASLSKVGASVQERDAIAVAKDASLASMRAKDASLAYKRAKDASLVPSLATQLPKMHLWFHPWQPRCQRWNQRCIFDSTDPHLWQRTSSAENPSRT